MESIPPFNIFDLLRFTGEIDDKAKLTRLRKNPLQEGGDDGKPLNKGPTIRATAKRIQDDWNFAKVNKIKLLSTWANFSLCTE